MLKIYLGDELLEFDDDDLDYMYVDEGAEGVVYQYGRDAIKIYKPSCFRARLSKEECVRLGTISTKRVLMPQKIVYDGDVKTFIGYSTPFIYKFPNARIMDMKVEDFVDELDVIRDDLKELSHSGVEMGDWHSENILYDGKHLFIGDPGGAFFRREVRCLQSMGNNIFTLNRFFKDEVFALAKLTKKSKHNLDVVFDDFEYMGTQIRDTLECDESVRKYVKRMTK